MEMQTSNILDLMDYAESSYLDYAIVTVKGRAIPDIRDGQKPVQRRILYAMHVLGLGGTAKPVKGARVVGDVLGKYHPHGDKAAYDAMVRMAQDFTLRYPIVIGSGNYGSRDGDPPAAMRYTEAKLSPISDLLLSEIGMGTVTFMANYDGSFQEPTVLPARLPFTLLNGSKGVAVGIANDILPHNLREVAEAAIAVIRNPSISVAELLEIIPGPDFPDGGQVISSKADILSSYSTGRGSIRCRAVWKREDLARGQWQVAISELPYQVSTTKVLEEIDTLTNPKPKAGKKSLDQQQIKLKQLALDLLDTVRDESGKDASIRLVIEPKNSKVDEGRMMAFLLANTSLEAALTVNMTSISLEGRPQTTGILTFLHEWAAFRMETVRRRSAYLLEADRRRIHILLGRMLAFDAVDLVVSIIRESDNPREVLQEKLKLSEIQADDILEMRLRQLNRLEGAKLAAEIAEVRKSESYLMGLIDTPAELKKLVISEIEADSKKYGDDRRTLIQAEARSESSGALSMSVPDEEITVVLSKNLWLKAYKGHDVATDALSFKAGDEALSIVKTRTLSNLYVLDSTGRAFSFTAAQAPQGRGDGIPLTTAIELQSGARVITLLAGGDDERYIFATTGANGYIAPLKSLQSRQKAGKTFMKLGANDVPLVPVQVPLTDDGFVLCGARDGRVLSFALAELKTLPAGGQGVILMGVEAEGLASIRHLATEAFTGTVMQDGKLIPVELTGETWARYAGRRARKGAALPKKAVLL